MLLLVCYGHDIYNKQKRTHAYKKQTSFVIKNGKSAKKKEKTMTQKTVD